MAENPIRKEDIIDIEGLREELKGLISDLIKLAEVMKGDLTAAARGYREETEKIDVTTKEGRQAVKEKMKDVTDLTKQYNALNKAVDTLNKDLKKVPEVGSYNDLNNKLRELRNQFKSTADEGIQRGLIPKINELDKKLKGLDASIGNHQRNVGNYSKSVIDAGKQLLTFGGAAAVAAGVMRKLKEAFLETTFGLNQMNIAGEISKQIFLDLASFNFNAGSIIQATELAKRANEIRQGDILDIMRIARLEKEMQVLRFRSSDATKGEATMLENLNKFQEKENELIDYKIRDKQEELDLEMAWLEIRPSSEKHLKRTAQLYAEIQAIQGERNFRIESRKSAMEERQRKKEEDWNKKLQAWYDEIEKDKKEAYEKEIERKDKELRAEIEKIDAIDFAKSQSPTYDPAQAIELSKQLTDIKLKEIETIKAAEQDLTEFQKGLTKEVRDEKIITWTDEASKYIDVAENINSAFINTLQKRKEKELSAVGDNAEAREKIEREYANKEKAFAISEAIINGAGAIVRQFQDLPFFAALVTSALTAATTATQIGIISSQKFAEGGYTGDGSMRDSTGERVAGVVHEKEYVIPKEPTRKYRALLEAIHADNPMAIAEELKNRQFHMVWGGVQPRLSESYKQDPYTQLMYSLMKNSVTTYQDSNGDTVLRYSDGTTRIVRGKA